MPFTEDLKRSLAQARLEAHRLRHESVRPEHLALGVLRSDSPSVSTIVPAGRTVELVAALEQYGGRGTTVTLAGDLPYASGSKDAIAVAMHEARAEAQAGVTSRHLLQALLQAPDGLPAIFAAFGISAAARRQAKGPDVRGR